MNKVINVLGFSACAIPACDCGGRMVLGMKRGVLRELKAVLEREGFVFTEPPRLPVPPGAYATEEPLYEGALSELEEYLALDPSRR